MSEVRRIDPEALQAVAGEFLAAQPPFVPHPVPPGGDAAAELVAGLTAGWSATHAAMYGQRQASAAALAAACGVDAAAMSAGDADGATQIDGAL